MSLGGKKILITRPVDQSDTLSQLLRERNAEVLYFPTIHILPPESWEACDEAIDTYRTYDALIFTSVNAVKYFFNRAVERGLQPGLLPKNKVFVVGGKTAEAVASFGIMAARFPGVTNAAMLEEALCASPVLGKRFLFPKGNLAGSGITESLRKRGATVDEVVVYVTAAGGSSASGNGEGAPDACNPAGASPCSSPYCNPDQVSALLRSGEIDAITFFSPSSVDNFFAIVPHDALGTAALAAIGPTTAHALSAASLPVHIMAAHPTSEDLVSALEQYFITPTRNEEL